MLFSGKELKIVTISNVIQNLEVISPEGISPMFSVASSDLLISKTRLKIEELDRI
jgi:hypothetical protein